MSNIVIEVKIQNRILMISTISDRTFTDTIFMNLISLLKNIENVKIVDIVEIDQFDNRILGQYEN